MRWRCRCSVVVQGGAWNFGTTEGSDLRSKKTWLPKRHLPKNSWALRKRLNSQTTDMCTSGPTKAWSPERTSATSRRYKSGDRVEFEAELIFKGDHAFLISFHDICNLQVIYIYICVSGWFLSDGGIDQPARARCCWRPSQHVLRKLMESAFNTERHCAR